MYISSAGDPLSGPPRRCLEIRGSCSLSGEVGRIRADDRLEALDESGAT
jgi:hypothetical protein